MAITRISIQEELVRMASMNEETLRWAKAQLENSQGLERQRLQLLIQTLDKDQLRIVDSFAGQVKEPIHFTNEPAIV